MDLGKFEQQTVGSAISNVLKHAGIKLNESALKECGMDWQQPMQEEDKERYSLTITSKDKTITVSTTNPEDVIHIMKLGGMDITSHEITPLAVGGASEPVPAGGIEIEVPVTDMDSIDSHEEHEEDEDDTEEGDEFEVDGKEYDVEEAKEPFGNSPSTTNSTRPRIVGNTEDFGMNGTGEGNSQYGNRRAPGQGDNPMGWEDMEESYTSFKKINESKKKKPDADHDGVPDWADKKPGKDDNEIEKEEEVKETAIFKETLSLLKKYAGI